MTKLSIINLLILHTILTISIYFTKNQFPLPIKLKFYFNDDNTVNIKPHYNEKHPYQLINLEDNYIFDNNESYFNKSVINYYEDHLIMSYNKYKLKSGNTKSRYSKIFIILNMFFLFLVITICCVIFIPNDKLLLDVVINLEKPIHNTTIFSLKKYNDFYDQNPLLIMFNNDNLNKRLKKFVSFMNNNIMNILKKLEIFGNKDLLNLSETNIGFFFNPQTPKHIYNSVTTQLNTQDFYWEHTYHKIFLINNNKLITDKNNQPYLFYILEVNNYSPESEFYLLSYDWLANHPTYKHLLPVRFPMILKNDIYYDCNDNYPEYYKQYWCNHKLETMNFYEINYWIETINNEDISKDFSEYLKKNPSIQHNEPFIIKWSYQYKNIHSLTKETFLRTDTFIYDFLLKPPENLFILNYNSNLNAYIQVLK